MQSVDGVKGFRSVFNGVQSMVREHGPRSLWRGLVPTMWRDVPFSGKWIDGQCVAVKWTLPLIVLSSAFYWMSYEKSRSLLVRKTSLNAGGGPVDAMTEFKLAFASGAISGMVRYAGLRNMKLLCTCLANLTAFQLAAILTTPFDLIKTHRQIRSREGRLI